MQMNKTLKKALAVSIVFVLIFADFAIVSKTAFVYAADVAIEYQNSKTANDNVEFDAYFINERSEKTYRVSKDVNEEASITLGLKVKNAGYLKNAVININGESNGNTNFDIKEKIEANDIIQSFEKNEIKLKLINYSNIENKIIIPIVYNKEDYIELNKISQNNNVRLSAIYVDNKGKEIKIEKNIILNLNWQDNSNIEVETKTEKYVPYETAGKKGVIFQTSIKLHGQEKNNVLPVNETKLEIEIPKITNMTIQKVNVIARSTKFTNGLQDELVKFDTSNWIYDKANGKIYISVKNEKTENNKYYSLNNMDEYIITYTYVIDNIQNLNVEEKNVINQVIIAEISRFGNDKKITNNIIANYDITKKVGDFVSYSVESSPKEISKGYIYANYNVDDNFYETEFNEKMTINVTCNDIVDGVLYKDAEKYFTDKDGNKYKADDIYYKQITFNKENLLQVLGQEGKIDILDSNGSIIKQILNIENIEADENGNYKLTINDLTKNIKIKISKPIIDGNINIDILRAMNRLSYEKQYSKNFTELTINTELLADYNYVGEYVNIAKNETKTKLNETVSDAKVSIEPNTLSTIYTNNDVKMRIELNNNNINSDMYENALFEIRLPSYIDNIEISDAKLLYGEGLEIEKAELLKEEKGYVIKVKLAGKQKKFASKLIQGTTIIISAKIEINVLTPAIEDEIKLYYINEGYTNYKTSIEEGIGYYSEKIEFVAPVGVTPIAGTANYNDEQNTIYSAKGNIEDTIKILSPERTATMELVVMNNYKNDISNISIIGTIPFKNNKSIIKQEDLNTTADVILKSPIKSDNQDYKVYYSENQNVTNNINDINNGWTENVTDFSKIKAYLIVLNKDYKLNPSELLKFNYEYELPGNLEHNNNINSNFAVYYTNNTQEAILQEQKESNIIGLTTGAGPVLDIQLKSNAEGKKVKEFQEIIYTAKIENTGDMPANNVKVSMDAPEYTNVSSYRVDNEDIKVDYSLEDGKITFNMAELAVGNSEEMNIYVNTHAMPTVEEYYSDNEIDLNENDTEIQNVKLPEIKLKAEAEVTADEFDTVIKSNEIDNTLETADFAIEESTEEETLIIKENKEVEFDIQITNLKDQVQSNVLAKTSIPEGLTFKEAYMIINGEAEIQNAEYNTASREVIWNIGNVEAEGNRQLRLVVYTENLPSGITKTTLYSNSIVYGDGTETYTSNTVQTTIGRGSLFITQTTDHENTYVTEGDTIKYIFNIKNEGTVDADDLTFIDNIPEGLKPQRIEVTSKGKTSKRTISGSSVATLKTSIAAGENIEVVIVTIAASLNGAQEKSVTNSATIEATNISRISSNEITHIIETDVNANTDPERATTNNRRANQGGSNLVTNQNESGNNNIGRTYTISGTAWVDENSNGMRDSNESRVSELVARLINANNNNVVKELKTNTNGEYAFTGLESGNYFIVFEYDTLKYGLTEYQKTNIATNVNSDVITNKIQENGIEKNVATTNTITLNSTSISNIDIGFTIANRFDLSINKVVSKVTVQTNEGTKSIDFENNKLAKVEIGSKYIVGSTVLVEYSIIVKNEGDIAGTARKIIDYVPKEMTFNSTLNPNWYTGQDGNIYTTELTDKTLLSGESAEIKLVLSKVMTDSNQGMVYNEAEIYEDYNVYGVSDIDSKPGNKAQGEDDINSAGVIISVRTGESLIYLSIIISTLTVLGVGIFIVRTSIVSKNKIGGAF